MLKRYGEEFNFAKTEKTRSVGGFGLLDFLMFMTLTSSLILVVTSNTDQQVRKLASYNEKMDVDILSDRLSWRLGDSASCSSNLSGQRINPGNPGNTKVSLSILYYAGPGTPVLAQVGQRLPSSTHHVIVESITLKNVTNVNSNIYSGNIVVAFQKSKYGMPVAPVSVPISIITGGSPAGTITSCKSPGNDRFSGVLLYTSPVFSWVSNPTNNLIDTTTLSADYNWILLEGRSECYSSSGGRWSKVTVQFLDSSQNNTGLYSAVLAFNNSSNPYLDQDFNRNNTDSNFLMIPKVDSSVVRYINLILERQSECSISAYYQLYR